MVKGQRKEQKEGINAENLSLDFRDQPLIQPEHTNGQERWEDQGRKRQEEES